MGGCSADSPPPWPACGNTDSTDHTGNWGIRRGSGFYGTVHEDRVDYSASYHFHHSGSVQHPHRSRRSNNSNRAARRRGLTSVLCGRWPVVPYGPPATEVA